MITCECDDYLPIELEGNSSVDVSPNLELPKSLSVIGFTESQHTETSTVM
jgi:hypothetical protein